jgi:Alpha/beta hydrolase domain
MGGNKASILTATPCAVCLNHATSSARVPGRAPLPTIAGPIPMTPSSHPMITAAYAKNKYVEEEYFISGIANVYQEAADRTLSLKASGAPYKTRVLVRRPKDPRNFSGNAIDGPMNPSTNVDLVDPWINARHCIMGHGDVYIGMTAKPVAFIPLKKFDPELYGSLTMTSPNNESCPNPPQEPQSKSLSVRSLSQMPKA